METCMEGPEAGRLAHFRSTLFPFRIEYVCLASETYTNSEHHTSFYDVGEEAPCWRGGSPPDPRQLLPKLPLLTGLHERLSKGPVVFASVPFPSPCHTSFLYCCIIFHSLAPMYYRGSAAAVIVYDITKQDSFYTLKKWVKELKEHGPENIVMAIAGNKCDLSDIREVPLKDAKEYAESIGAIVVETSAKNAINIEELFQGISRQIPPLDPHENGNNGIKLVKPTSQASRRCC
ncbi:hypothetical protein H8959_001819 [Pygathrix nigripes]